MSVILTSSAASKIRHLIDEEDSSEQMMFRISVNGGGCSGFQYSFSLDTTKSKDDHLFTEQGVKIIIDEASLSLVEGSQIDFVEELIGSSFQIKNPNASSACGCGNSFSI